MWVKKNLNEQGPNASFSQVTDRLTSKVVSGYESSNVSFAQSTSRLASKMTSDYVSIGVTGFSGSGKSTFITSLIHQLKYSNEALLGGFLPARDENIVDVKLLPIYGLKLFDYPSGIEALSSHPPQWPASTTESSGCIVEITYKRKVPFYKPFFSETTKLNVEIRDYPGEWLLDIPLLDQNYLEWCLEVEKLYQQPQQKQIMGSLRSELLSISPYAVLTENEIEGLFERFQLYLQACKQHGITLIQPGHVLLPGESDSFAPFFPLLAIKNFNKKRLAKADKNCIYKVMQRRFNDYVSGTVKPFYNHFFTNVDRQVVLIDSLKALSSGKDNFEDMLVAFRQILDSYKIGSGNFINQLVSPKVERIMFLSSKPDRVLMNQHENLRHFTNSIIKRICSQGTRNRIRIDNEVVSAVRCTTDNHDHLLVTLSDGKKGKLKHPEMPEKMPSEEQWGHFENWLPPELQPPHVPGLKYGARLPCIRMDTVLNYLIGDKF